MGYLPYQQVQGMIQIFVVFDTPCSVKTAGSWPLAVGPSRKSQKKTFTVSRKIQA